MIGSAPAARAARPGRLESGVESSVELPARLERWLDENRARPVSVVLGGGCNGLSFVRSLGRRSLPTLLLDTDRSTAMHTRFGEAARIPSARHDPEGWIAFLELVGAHLAEPGYLFATSDIHILAVARYEERLRPCFRFLVPELRIVEQIVNKRSQYGFAGSMGIPMPGVFFPESVEEAIQFAAQVSYPCILKPYHSQASWTELDGRKVVAVQSSQDLVAEYTRLASLGVQLMIQELIPGGDDALFGYLAFWDREGRERAWVTKRKLRQNPPHFGDGSVTITAAAPEVADLSRRLLGALGYRGFVGVEFKFDERDGSYRLMEINPRTVSCNQLAIEAGVDFPWIGYRYLAGADLGVATPIQGRFGVKHVNEEWDLQAYRALRRSGDLSFVGWITSLRGTQARALWAWDDPLPLVAVVVLYVRGVLSRGTGIVVRLKSIRASLTRSRSRTQT